MIENKIGCVVRLNVKRMMIKIDSKSNLLSRFLAYYKNNTYHWLCVYTSQFQRGTQIIDMCFIRSLATIFPILARYYIMNIWTRQTYNCIAFESALYAFMIHITLNK